MEERTMQIVLGPCGLERQDADEINFLQGEAE